MGKGSGLASGGGVGGGRGFGKTKTRQHESQSTLPCFCNSNWAYLHLSVSLLCVCVSQYYNRVTQCGYPGFPQLEPIYQYWLTCFPPHPNRHQTMMLYTPAHYTVYISLQSLSRWLTEDFSVRAISHFSCLLWGNGGNPAQPSSLNRELLYHCNILHTTTSKSSWRRLYRIWE